MFLAAQSTEWGETESRKCILGAGHTLWVPFGWVPCIMGLATPTQFGATHQKKIPGVQYPQAQKKKTDYRAFILTPMLNWIVKTESKKTCKNILSRLTTAHAFLPRTLGKHEQLAKFKASMEEVCAE